MSVSPQSLEGGVAAGPVNGSMAKAASGAKYALFLLFAINLLNFFDRQLLGALGEPVRHEFHLSDTALGFLGTIFTIIYAFVGLPLGALSDRWSRNKLIALGTAFWSILTAATGFAQNYAQIFIARLGVGLRRWPVWGLSGPSSGEEGAAAPPGIQPGGPRDGRQGFPSALRGLDPLQLGASTQKWAIRETVAGS